MDEINNFTSYVLETFQVKLSSWQRQWLINIEWTTEITKKGIENEFKLWSWECIKRKSFQNGLQIYQPCLS